MTAAGKGPAGHDLRHVHEEQAARAARQGNGLVRARPRVVIVGAGFAGLNAARALRRADAQVTIVDGHGYHTARRHRVPSVIRSGPDIRAA